MSKKRILLIIIGILFLILGIVSFILGRKKTEEIISPFAPLTSNLTPVRQEEKLKIYNDEAGFSFNYSESFSVAEVKNQDENTYSALEIYSSKKPEQKMTINVLDTQFSNTEEWLVKNKKAGWQVSETVLSGMNGKLIHTSEQVMTVAISKGIIFLLESPSDSEGFWESQHKIIGESFSVQWPAETKTGGADQTIIFEEEIIE